MEILVRGRNGDAAQTQIVLGDPHFLRRADGSVGSMPAKPISFCGYSADVVGDVAVGDLRAQVAALEAEDDRLVDRCRSASSDVRDRPRGSCRQRVFRPGGAPARGGRWRVGDFTEVGLAELVGRLPNMRVTIDDQKTLQRNRQSS